MVGPGPDRAVVFQDAALFPWLTLRANVEFPLELQGLKAKPRALRSEQLLRMDPGQRTARLALAPWRADNVNDHSILHDPTVPNRLDGWL